MYKLKYHLHQLKMFKHVFKNSIFKQNNYFYLKGLNNFVKLISFITEIYEEFFIGN